MKRFLPAAVLAAVAALLLAFAAAPLAVVIGRAFGLPRTFTVAPIAAALASEEVRGALATTIAVSLATAAFAVLLGVPLAFALVRLELPFARQLRTLLTLPAVVPPYLWAIAWIDLANPRTGLLNRIAPLFDVYGPGGMVWVLGLCFYPFVLLPVAAALERMDASLEESARISGASPLRALTSITLPLVLPSVAGGAVLVFLDAAASFSVPYLIGTAGATRTHVLTTAIVRHITVGGEEDVRAALAMSVLLLLVSLLAAALSGLALRGARRFAVVSGKGARPRKLPLPRAALAAVAVAVALIAAAGVLMPLGTLFLVSIQKAWGAGLGPANWSLDHYRRVLFEVKETVPALFRSTWLAALAATLAVAAGGVVAYARARKPSAFTAALESLANAPYAVPGTVLALGLLFTWSREVRVIFLDRLTLALDLFSGAWALLVAYTVKYLAFGVRTSSAALVQLDPTLEDAARTAGASRVRAAVDVVVPLLLPALFAAWLLVFLPALGEITMSVLLVGPGTEVVGTVLFELQSYADPPSAAVLACLLVALTLLGNAALRRLTGGRGGF